MATFDVLAGRLTIDNAGLLSGLQAAGAAAQRFAAQLNQALRGIGEPKALSFDKVANGLNEAARAARKLTESLDKPLLGAKDNLEAVAKATERVGKIAEGGSGLAKWAAQIVEHSQRAQQVLSATGISAEKLGERLRRAGEGLEWLKTAGDSAKPLYEAFQNIAPVVDRLKPVMTAAAGNVRSGMTKIGATIRGGFASIRSAATGLTPAFRGIGSALANPLGTIRSGIARIGPAFASLEPVFGAVGTALLNPLGLIESAVAALGPVFTSLGGVASVVFSPITLAIAGIAAGAYLVYRNWESITSGMAKIWQSISTQASQAWGAIRPPIEAVWNVAKQFGAFLWDTLAAALEKVGDALQEVATTIIDAARPAFEAMYGEGGLLGTVVKGVWEILKSLWEVIKSLALAIWDVLKPPLTWFWEILKDLFSVIGSVLGVAWDVVKVIFRWAGALTGSLVISLQTTIRWVLFLIEALVKLARFDFKGIGERFKEVAAESKKDAEKIRDLWAGKAKEASESTVQSEADAAQKRLEIEQRLQQDKAQTNAQPSASPPDAASGGESMIFGRVTPDSAAVATPCDCAKLADNDCLQKLCDALSSELLGTNENDIQEITEKQEKAKVEFKQSHAVQVAQSQAAVSSATQAGPANATAAQANTAVSRMRAADQQKAADEEQKKVTAFGLDQTIKEGLDSLGMTKDAYGNQVKDSRQQQVAQNKLAKQGSIYAKNAMKNIRANAPTDVYSAQDKQGNNQALAFLDQYVQKLAATMDQAQQLTGKEQADKIAAGAKVKTAIDAMAKAFADGEVDIKKLGEAGVKAAGDIGKLDEAEQQKLAHAKGELTPQEQQQQQVAQQQQQQFAQQVQQAWQQGAQQMGQQAWESGQAMLQQALGGPGQVQAMIDEAVKTGDMKSAVALIRQRAEAQLGAAQINLHNLASDPAAGGGFGASNGGVSNDAYFMTLDLPLVHLIKFLQAQLAHLPKMAAGGIVTGATNAIIGEAGPEAVLPLTGFINMLGALPVFGSIQNAMQRVGDFFNNQGNPFTGQRDPNYNPGLAEQYFANLSKIQDTFDYASDRMWNARGVNFMPAGMAMTPAMLAAERHRMATSSGLPASNTGHTFNVNGIHVNANGLDLTDPAMAQRVAQQIFQSLDNEAKRLGTSMMGNSALLAGGLTSSGRSVGYAR